MSLLLKNVLVQDLNSPVHSKQANILIEKGLIISLSGKSATKEIDLKGKIVSCGWFDLNAQFHDPGNEHREDILSGTKVAQAGGFTDVCLTPETHPPIESKSDVNYLLRRSLAEVDIHVCSAISEGLRGENLTEMLDLHEAGSVAFSEGDHPVWNAELLLKALQHTRDIRVPVFQNARDVYIAANTHMHEGKISTNLGLRGEPSLAEELIILRDIEILKYSGGSIHFSRISTSRGVELIRTARKAGMSITCDVGIHHLIFTENSIGDFDTNFKALPPYRTEMDRKALVKGVREGTIDAICSNHRPYDQECKQLEFDLSEAGNISLQTFFPSLMKIVNEVSLEILLDRVTNGPRKVLKMGEVKIDVGQVSKLTIFDPEETWQLNNQTNMSKSRNSPYWEMKLKGRITGTVNGQKVTLIQ